MNNRKRVALYVKDFDPEKIGKDRRKLEKNCRNIAKYAKIMKNTDGTKNAVKEIEAIMGRTR